MLLTFDETVKKINEGGLLHISGTQTLLEKLPKGNWLGGTGEHFMGADGGVVTKELFFVTPMPYDTYKIQTYTTDTIKNVVIDGYENGFTIIILPFGTPINAEYALNANNYEEMYMRPIAGWVAGRNLDNPEQIPKVGNGQEGQVYEDKGVALHVKLPEGKVASVNIVNIFSPDEKLPVLEFDEQNFVVQNCIVDGEKTSFASFLKEHNASSMAPMIGDYSGASVNISLQAVTDDGVQLAAPPAKGIKYRWASPVEDYAAAFQSYAKELESKNIAFACNCLYNFMYGQLEGKQIPVFAGPATWGEIAYKLVNQTFVYIAID
ncbi:MAG: hypothetical protein FWE21_05475 [Defluviitaleaceae bacterium]|nr:hypothetical protein [Defluviitaleaceae bacterium]